MNEVFKSPFFVFKIVEVILGIICTLLIGNNLPSNCVIQNEITYTAIYAYILLNIIVIIGFLTDEPLSRRLTVIISGSGALFSAVAGVILMNTWFGNSVPKRFLSSSLIAFLNAAVYIGDSAYTCLFVQE